MSNPEFLSWCKSHGIVSNGVAPGLVPQGWRGIVAVEDIPEGACIMCVPAQLLMSGDSALKDPVLAPLLQSTQLSNHQVLCIHLLHEAAKGPSSFWHLYIQQLPPRYHTLCTWPPGAFQELQLPWAVAAAQAAQQADKARWKQAWAVLRDLGVAPKWCSWRAWQWASSTVSSRTMYLPNNPAGALTPLGDLHNYQPPAPPFTPSFQLDHIAEEAPTADAGAATAASGIAGDGAYDAEGLCYRIHARRRYGAGEEVFLCYGAYTNLELLELYGFLLPANPHDKVVIPSHLLPPGACAGVPSQQLAIHANGHPTWDLLRVLRMAAASPAEQKEHGHAAWEGRRISAASEARAAACLAAACQQLLRSLPTTLEQDREQEVVLLQQLQSMGSGQADTMGDTRHEREVLLLVVQWRIACKAALAAGVAYCQFVKQHLQQQGVSRE